MLHDSLVDVVFVFGYKVVLCKLLTIPFGLFITHSMQHRRKRHKMCQ